MFDPDQANYLAGVGILYDIVGALALGRGFLALSSAEMMAQASTSWGFNPHFIRSLAEQKYDARWGAVLLVTGFLLQGASSLGEQETALEAILTAVPLVPIIVCYFALRRPVTRRFGAAAVAVHTPDPGEQDRMMSLAFGKGT